MRFINLKGIFENHLRLLILVFVLIFQTINQIYTQISSFKMGDTLFLKPNDEFLDVRLSKFSTEKTGERHFYRTLVYYDRKPFTGTIVKAKGLSLSGREIIGSFANYSENEEDQTSFSVSYLNGKFFGRYFEENDEAFINLWFDKNGTPDKTGEIIIKKNGPRYLQHIPSPYPKFIPIKGRLSNGNYFIEFYRDHGLGIFNHRGNSESVNIMPLELQSLNEVIYKFAVNDPEFIDCRPKDTITFSFSQNRLMAFSYKDNCNSKVSFEKSEMIKEMPVIGAATNYGNNFNSIDYSQLLFSDQFSNDLFDSQNYYINAFVSGEQGNFFSTLDKLPAWVNVSEKDYNLDLHFNLEKAKKGAKQILMKDILSSEKTYGPYQDPIYQVSLPVKSFEINCDVIINNTFIKHLISKYVVSSDENYELTSEYWYDGDTVNIKTMGDLTNNILKKFEFQINPNTKPRNGEMKWLNIEYKGNDLYVIEATGRLGWDKVKNAQITSYQILAKSTNNKSTGSKSVQLKPDGTSTYIYEDGTMKQYKYKNGELMID